MTDVETYIADLKISLKAEKEAHKQRYDMALSTLGLKELKKQGLALHPLGVVNKSFTPDEQVQLTLIVKFGEVGSDFRLGASITCFSGEHRADGLIIQVANKHIQIVLFLDYFPDWLEEEALGLCLRTDEHTFELMEFAINRLEKPDSPILRNHLKQVKNGENAARISVDVYENPTLNDSQNQAISSILAKRGIQIVHGPPGTGKTTTLSHAIHRLVKSGKKIMVSAPSNAAVDVIGLALLSLGVKVLRVGNNIKMADEILPFSMESKLEQSEVQKRIKQYQKQLTELRKKAGSFKRVFDKEAREERNQCFAEIKALRKEIKAERKYGMEQIIKNSDVYLGTPVGLYDEFGDIFTVDYLFLDEAGQCHDALAWLLAHYSENWILAGDIHQLPPTYLSQSFHSNGNQSSALEFIQKSLESTSFLDLQYRMRPVVANFSNAYFYENRLKHHKKDLNDEVLLFFDTAGMGLDEEQTEENDSKFNSGEADLVAKFLNSRRETQEQWQLISPYQAQVDYVKSLEIPKLKVSTIDSFQGREAANVILSLVRSNAEQTIGFLKDYRRMNVSLTRAKERLVIFADSSTIGNDPFYKEFLDYCEQNNAYHSGFELIY